jgi:hypothetical protein
MALLGLPAAAQGLTFGPDLSSATANNPYTCSLAGGFSGCTVQDPRYTDMELVLPDPIVNGNQTGVVMAIHVLSAATAPAQFVAVEWSGRRNEGQPFPSGVMAVSQQVTLQPGLNHFTTNLPVDRRLAANGFESWSVVSLSILDGTSPVPAQLGGAFATTGVLLDNGLPLTQTTSDLTAPPHNMVVGGFPPATLLMSGDVTITTPQGGGGGNTPTPTPTPAPVAPAAPQLTITTIARIRGNRARLRLQCGGAVACTGTLVIQNRGVGRVAGAKASTKGQLITYARGSFSVPAGQRRFVEVKLSKRGETAIGRRRSLTAYANARFSDGRAENSRITLKH